MNASTIKALLPILERVGREIVRGVKRIWHKDYISMLEAEEEKLGKQQNKVVKKRTKVLDEIEKKKIEKNRVDKSDAGEPLLK